MNERALKVLEQYELEIAGTRRGRGNFIFETDKGSKQLCEFHGSEKKLEVQNRILWKIREAGCRMVDTAVENREGKLVSADRDENRYVVKDWFPGRECGVFCERDILAAVEHLARLHQLMRFPEETKEYCGVPLREELVRRTRELKKVRAFVRGREPRQPFEQLFLNSFQIFWEQAAAAVERAGTLYGEQELDAEIESGAVCHGDYNYHHVLFLDCGIATTEFGRFRFDFQVNDLYQFARKILEKHDWDAGLGMRMVEAYERIRPLPRLEREILAVRMAYPEKFWKLTNHYYGSRKAWLPARYLQKLELLLQQQDARNNFIKLLE